MFNKIANIAKNISNCFFQKKNLNDSKKTIEYLINTHKSEKIRCNVIEGQKYIRGRIFKITLTYDFGKNGNDTIYYMSYEKIGKFGDPVFYLRPYIKKDILSTTSTVVDNE